MLRLLVTISVLLVMIITIAVAPPNIQRLKALEKVPTAADDSGSSRSNRRLVSRGKFNIQQQQKQHQIMDVFTSSMLSAEENDEALIKNPTSRKRRKLLQRRHQDQEEGSTITRWLYTTPTTVSKDDPRILHDDDCSDCSSRGSDASSGSYINMTTGDRDHEIYHPPFPPTSTTSPQESEETSSPVIADATLLPDTHLYPEQEQLGVNGGEGGGNEEFAAEGEIEETDNVTVNNTVSVKLSIAVVCSTNSDYENSGRGKIHDLIELVVSSLLDRHTPFEVRGFMSFDDEGEGGIITPPSSTTPGTNNSTTNATMSTDHQYHTGITRNRTNTANRMVNSNSNEEDGNDIPVAYLSVSNTTITSKDQVIWGAAAEDGHNTDYFQLYWFQFSIEYGVYWTFDNRPITSERLLVEVANITQQIVDIAIESHTMYFELLRIRQQQDQQSEEDNIDHKEESHNSTNATGDTTLTQDDYRNNSTVHQPEDEEQNNGDDDEVLVWGGTKITVNNYYPNGGEDDEIRIGPPIKIIVAVAIFGEEFYIGSSRIFGEIIDIIPPAIDADDVNSEDINDSYYLYTEPLMLAWELREYCGLALCILVLIATTTLTIAASYVDHHNHRQEWTPDTMAMMAIAAQQRQSMSVEAGGASRAFNPDGVANQSSSLSQPTLQQQHCSCLGPNLTSEQGVGELLRIGWRYHDHPPHPRSAHPPRGVFWDGQQQQQHPPPPPPKPMLLQIYDKGRRQRNDDDDSMLRGDNSGSDDWSDNQTSPAAKRTVEQHQQNILVVLPPPGAPPPNIPQHPPRFPFPR